MSKPAEIGSTFVVVVVFVVLLVVAGFVGNEKAGTVGAILAFVLLSTGAGYFIAQRTYA